MNDVFGYIAYGDNELYHLGALLSALKLLHHSPKARIIVATDKPAFFRGYPLETILVSAEKKKELSFDWRYHFGIKAGGLIELLKRADRLLFMDTDMYPVGDLSRAFGAIRPGHSIMRLCEGPHAWCPRLEGKGVRVGDHVVTGHEPMWNSGVLGVHRDNLPALLDAYLPMLAVHEIAKIDAAEQFCIGIALSQDGRTVSPHRLKIRNYNTRGKKLFAGQRVRQFFSLYGDATIAQQIAKAARYRLWRTPVDLWHQRRMWSA
ncbi:MAG: hypothetical protein E5X23_23650 [Mesorhizobium sp.]|uniref:hypothetical protein n=1 Tax=unclassified Mesorhizobium TaxID=325217 RepID=UPI0008016A5D|nr:MULTISPECIES: hypothetical protein [unclassified Mesorhizobium]TGV91915.1 hypothetical protein EN801_013380 [Mesorhizobium sp. M00.F.Ca.ET.158.01.1.1]AZO58657.1 hypothetical protein EJ078_04495 [Mesorhizobium sp. M1A.F.Ca.IN.022.06.1.1]MCT2579219.1 hypothetical protein [Mesorhizobium sp. P13.3]MDF3168608.1 hypothetical protein [Mesorhizobium sp. P16.1]MDF3178418.1 hypothetical protein [Mesorhizobium sp. P17.1]